MWYGERGVRGARRVREGRRGTVPNQRLFARTRSSRKMRMFRRVHRLFSVPPQIEHEDWFRQVVRLCYLGEVFVRDGEAGHVYGCLVCGRVSVSNGVG